jgi:hypothetical protein
MQVAVGVLIGVHAPQSYSSWTSYDPYRWALLCLSVLFAIASVACGAVPFRWTDVSPQRRWFKTPLLAAGTQDSGLWGTLSLVVSMLAAIIAAAPVWGGYVRGALLDCESVVDTILCCAVLSRRRKLNVSCVCRCDGAGGRLELSPPRWCGV